MIVVNILHFSIAWMVAKKMKRQSEKAGQKIPSHIHSTPIQRAIQNSSLERSSMHMPHKSSPPTEPNKNEHNSWVQVCHSQEDNIGGNNSSILVDVVTKQSPQTYCVNDYWSVIIIKVWTWMPFVLINNKQLYESVYSACIFYIS